MGSGVERIEDEQVLAAVRAQARRVLYRSLVAAGAVMVVLALLT